MAACTECGYRPWAQEIDDQADEDGPVRFPECATPVGDMEWSDD
jgi:hypothetical protein